MWGGAFFPFQADLGILQFKGGADGAERLPQVGDVALHAAGGLVGAHVFDVSGDNGGDGGLGGQRVVVAAIKRRLQLPDLFLGQLEGRGIERDSLCPLAGHVLRVINVTSLDKACHL